MAVLASLYESIAEPLVEVRRIFDAQIRSDVPFVNDLCEHITQFRGKMLRPALVLLTGQACGRLRQDHVGLATVVEMVHMATLVHDDVLDESDVRRRVPTVNHLKGNEAAVLLGDHLIAHAFRYCNSLGLPFGSDLIGRTTNTICEGELLQVHHRGNWALTEDEYFQIIGRKTASLTATCCVLGAYYAGAGAEVISALRHYGYEVGVAFQIVDDVLDVVGHQESTGKTLGRDLEQGELTLPLVHYLRHADPASRSEALGVLGNGHLGRAETIYQLLSNSQSIEYAMSTARQRIEQACRNLEVLEPSAARDALAAVADFVFYRQQ
ncbi:MAG TPA: polyprenyl synthetase family protein [Phycisphaerae bacterium]|nr:polyprenyl synthetase family protein [Phycisphaerae bacterium]